MADFPPTAKRAHAEERADPTEFYNKGKEGVKLYDEATMKREYDRFMKGIDNAEGDISNLLPSAQGKIDGISERYMNSGENQEIIYGSAMYIKAKGIDKKVKDKLNALLKKSDLSTEQRTTIQELLKGPSGGKSSGIEKIVVPSIFGAAALVGLFFGLNSLTGAAIGFGSAPSGFLGAVLFVGGIAGLFFLRKK